MSHFSLSGFLPPPDDVLHATVELKALMLLELLGGNSAAHHALEGIVILHRDLEYRFEQLERLLLDQPG